MSWIRLSTAIDSHVSVPVKLTQTEFLVAVQSGLYVYNTQYDGWFEFLNFDNGIEGRFASVEIDREKQILYIKTIECMLVVIDMKLDYFFPLFFKTRDATWGHGRLMLLNGQLNLISGFSQTKHFIWDELRKSFEVRHSIVGLSSVTGAAPMCRVRQRGELRCDTLLLFKEDRERRFNEFGVWEASPRLLAEKFSNCGCAVTTNQKYVILIGHAPMRRMAFIGGEHILTCDSNYMFVFDTELRRLFKSQVQCPERSEKSVAIVMADSTEQIVAGYIRQHGEELEGGIPHDIYRLVCEFAFIEYLHWIADNRDHWKIEVGAVLHGMIAQ